METNWSACLLCRIIDSWVRLEGIWLVQLHLWRQRILTNHTGYLHRESGFYLYLPVSFLTTDRSRTILFFPFQRFILCVFLHWLDSSCFTGRPLLELANYHILSRIFYYVPSESPIPPSRVLTIFGPIMMIVETLNSLGVAFTSNPTSSQAQAGKILVLAAIGIQICLIITFFCFAGIFHWRCGRNGIRTKALPALPIVMYVSMFLIFIRSVYRMVEHAGNSDLNIYEIDALRSLSPLLRNEWYFFVFEGATMLANSLLWNVWHPSRYLPQTKNIFLAEDGVTEMMWEETTGNQPTLAKTVHEGMAILTLGVWGHIYPLKNQNDRHQKQIQGPLHDASNSHAWYHAIVMRYCG